MAKKEQTFKWYVLKQKLVPYLFMLPNGIFFEKNAVKGVKCEKI